MNTVICFSGGIGSGKTSLTAAVSDRTGIVVASFGRFVRATAEARGIAGDRDSLQTLGEALINELGWESFCRSVINAAGWTAGASLIVDGIRHVAAFEHVERVVAPTKAKLVFVDLTPERRQARLDASRPDEGTVVSRADAHSTEKDVHGALRSRADLILDGTRVLSDLVDDVCKTYSSGSLP
jgi:dephospho-CoA kinase